MTKHLRIFSIILSINVLWACNNVSTDSNFVSVSILPQKQWIDTLTSGTINVNAMVEPGSNPVTYSPTTAQMKSLSKSALYFYIGGLGFENAWLTKFEKLSPETAFINTTLGIERLENSHHHEHGEHCSHGESDPHLWSSPRQAKKMVENIYTELLKSEKLSAEILKANFEKINLKLDRLDSLMVLAEKTAKNKTIVIYHPALGYLARDYGFEQVSIEKDGKAPSAEHLKWVIDFIKTNHINYIFVQKQFDRKSAQLIAKESGATLVEIDPLGYDYFTETEKIALKLALQ